MANLFVRTLDEHLAVAESILSQAVERWNPSAVYAAYSGGNDSLPVAHWASAHPRFRGCIHVNTGIGVPETREHVRETCKRFGWPLFELHPPDLAYEDFVLRFGFPGPASHRYAYSWLKERPLRKFITATKAGPRDHPLILTGVRLAESNRRMGTAKPIQQDAARVWVAPFLYFQKADMLAYIDRFGLPVSPVAARLGMSGECLCGAFAMPGELDRLRDLYPEVVQQIEALEEKAAAVGVPCQWGERPPQTPTIPDGQPAIPMLCTGCEFRAEWFSRKEAVNG